MLNLDWSGGNLEICMKHVIMHLINITYKSLETQVNQLQNVDQYFIYLYKRTITQLKQNN